LLDAGLLTDMTSNPNVLWAQVNSGNLVTVPVSGAWYGMGWLVNTAGNWWHGGSLPGTVTEQVHAANGFGVAAFFNLRPYADSNGLSPNLGSDLDTALWIAFRGAGNFGDVDLFDQYGAYTGWMNAASYQSQFDAHQAAGQCPSRVEGFSSTGTPLYRAVFAPSHVTAWESHHGIDCPTYQSRAAALAAQGYGTASLQSFVSSDGTRRYQATWVK
jgi:hypothetical protein